MATTGLGRVHINAAAPVLVMRTGAAPMKVRLWVGEWYNREIVHFPVYVSYTKKDCSPGNAAMLPMDSTVFNLICDPGTEIWACGDGSVLLNYAFDPANQAALV